jgi:hypothetical protein
MKPEARTMQSSAREPDKMIHIGWSQRHNTAVRNGGPMKQFKLSTLLLSLGGLLGTGKAILGHHSFAAEYDTDQMVTLTGTVTKFVWGNPHSHCLIDVKEQGGSLTNWDLELGGPGVLVQTGWSKNTLRTGDIIIARVALARNHSKTASARMITLPNGERLPAASPADGGPE